MWKVVGCILLTPLVACGQNCWGERPSGRSSRVVVSDRPFTGWHDGRYWVEGKEAPAPQEPEKKKPEPEPDAPLTGVIAEKLSQVEKASSNGRNLSIEELKSALRGQIPEDGAKLRVIVKGSDADKVSTDWATAPELRPYRDKYVLQAFPSTSWQVANYQEGVTLVRPDGEVLASGKYVGPQELAAGIEKYDPSKDKPLMPKPDPPATSSSGLAVVGFCVVMLLFAFKNKEGE